MRCVVGGSLASRHGCTPPSGLPSRRMASLPRDDDGYVVLSETVLHSRYVTLYNRVIAHPPTSVGAPSRSFSYDVVGHPRQNFHFVILFPFDVSTQAVTLVREYAHGPNCMIFGLPAGGVDPGKHSSIDEAARAELSEECHLRGGTLTRLLPHDHPGIVEGKWLRNRFTPFLVVNAVRDNNPGPRDAEEAAMTAHAMPLEAFEKLLYGGELMPPTVTCAALALRELRLQGLLKP